MRTGMMVSDTQSTVFQRNEVLRWSRDVAAPHDALWTPPDVAALASQTPFATVLEGGQNDGGACTDVQAAIDLVLAHAAAQPAHERYVIKVETGFYAGPVFIPKDAPPMALIGVGEVSIAAAIDAKMPGQEYEARYAHRVASSPPNVREIFARIAARDVLTTGNTAVLRIEADDVIVSNMRVENLYACDRASAAPEGATMDMEGRFADGQHQAVALHVAGADRVLLDTLTLSSFQDTLYLQSTAPSQITRVFLNACDIEGDVDFIFGNATALFENCTLRTRGLRGAQSWVVAPSTNIRTPYGFVFRDCQFTHDGAEAGQNGTSFVGRQWFEGVRATPYGTPDVVGYACTASDVSTYDAPKGTISRRTLEAVGKAVLIDCTIGPHIAPDRPWDNWSGTTWSPRFRPPQDSADAFGTLLGSWLEDNGLDYGDLDRSIPWLLIQS